MIENLLASRKELYTAPTAAEKAAKGPKAKISKSKSK